MLFTIPAIRRSLNGWQANSLAGGDVDRIGERERRAGCDLDDVLAAVQVNSDPVEAADLEEEVLQTELDVDESWVGHDCY